MGLPWYPPLHSSTDREQPMWGMDLNKGIMEFQNLAAVTLGQLQLHLAVEGLGDAFSWLLYQVSKSVWILYSYTFFILSVSQKNHATNHLFLEYLCAAIPTLNASHVSCLVVLTVALWGNALTPLQRWRIQGLERLKNFLINTKIFRGNAKIQLRHSDFWCWPSYYKL